MHFHILLPPKTEFIYRLNLEWVDARRYASFVYPRSGGHAIIAHRDGIDLRWSETEILNRLSELAEEYLEKVNQQKGK